LSIKYLASCSFGKDSIAAIITHLENGGHIDEAVYCKVMFDDKVSGEIPEHENWIHSVAIPKLEKDWGIKTTVLQSELTYVDYFYKKKKKGKYKGQIYGFPRIRGAWCNNILKTHPIRSYEKKLGSFKNIIGLAANEKGRMKGKRQKDSVVLPLDIHGVNEERSFEIAKKANLLSPAYDIGFHRLSCWFCHKQRLGMLRMIKNVYPNLWAMLLRLGKDSPFNFKIDYTTEQLDVRFELENKRLAEGKTINPRALDFRRALADRLKVL